MVKTENNLLEAEQEKIISPEEWMEEMKATAEEAEEVQDSDIIDDFGSDEELAQVRDVVKQVNEYEEMMRAGGLAVGTNQQSILKYVVVNYIRKYKKMLRLDWLWCNRPVKERNCDMTYWKPICDKIRDDIYNLYEEQRIDLNKKMDKGATKIKSLDFIPGWVIAAILIATGDVRVLDTTKAGYDGGVQRVVFRHYFQDGTKGNNPVMKWSGQWVVYDEKGKNKQKAVLRTIMLAIDPNSAKDRDGMNEYLYNAPTRYLNSNDKLIWWRNGVWDYDNKRFVGYDDPMFKELGYDEYVCLSKYVVNHPYGKMWGDQPEMEKDANGDPIEPKILEPDGKTVWSPSYQLRAPFEIGTPKGDATFDCYMRFMQFTLRGMNGSPHFYILCINGDGQGTNGKGTAGDMIELLMHNMPDRKHGIYGNDVLNSNVVIVASVDQVAENKALHLINGSNCMEVRFIRGQEAPVKEDGRNRFERKTIVKNCDDVKNIARVQAFTFRDLWEMPVTVVISVGLWSEHNDMPIFIDNSPSMTRALLVFSFNKYFGVKKGYIKDDYISRPEVRSWLAWFITTQLPCYEEYDEASYSLLREDADELLKVSLSASRFFDTVVNNIPLDVIPNELLYSMYHCWCDKEKTNINRRLGKDSFIREMEHYAKTKGSPVDFCKIQKRMSKKDYIVRNETKIKAFELVGHTYGSGDGASVNCGEYCTGDGRMNWDEFIQKNAGDKNIVMKLVRNCFVRKVSHFEQPIECEKVAPDETDPEYVVDDFDVREEMKSPGYMNLPEKFREDIHRSKMVG